MHLPLEESILGSAMPMFHVTLDWMAGHYGLIIQTRPNAYHWIPIATVIGACALLLAVFGIVAYASHHRSNTDDAEIDRQAA